MTERFRGAMPHVGWYTREKAEAELRSSGLGRLLESGVLVICDENHPLPYDGLDPRHVAGFAKDGKLFLNARSHNRNRPLLPTLFHEAFHALVPPLLGDAKWQHLMDELAALYEKLKSGDAELNRFWRQARERVQHERVTMGDTIPYGNQIEEFGAYALDSYVEKPPILTSWARRITGAAKAWTLRAFGVQLGEVTPSQLISLTKGAIRASLDEGVRPRSVSSYASQIAMLPPEDRVPDVYTTLGDLIDAYSKLNKPHVHDGIYALNYDDISSSMQTLRDLSKQAYGLIEAGLPSTTVVKNLKMVLADGCSSLITKTALHSTVHRILDNVEPAAPSLRMEF